MKWNPWLVAMALACAASACGGESSPPETDASDVAADAGSDSAVDPDSAVDAGEDAGYAWVLPPGFPTPNVPPENPMTEEKVQLGRHLFYDKRLSGNGTQSCASCHSQKKAFTDGRATGLGSTGQSHTRGAMSLANVAYYASFTWANPQMVSLEQQALVPMFGEAPVELGLSRSGDTLVAMLTADSTYQTLFQAAFGDDPAVFSVDNVTRAIACFERTLLSGTSPYDHYASEGDEDAISDAAKRGSVMVQGAQTSRFECHHCHGGYAFAASVSHTGLLDTSQAFFNTGLYNIGGGGAYPPSNEGIKQVTELASDMGRFKPPTLRNIALTAPYMHDGSIATLDEVIDHYSAGGRTIQSGPYAGVGRLSPLKDGFVHGFMLSGSERGDLLAFLESLTDEEFINDPRHADPWPDGSPAKGTPDL